LIKCSDSFEEYISEFSAGRRQLSIPIIMPDCPTPDEEAAVLAAVQKEMQTLGMKAFRTKYPQFFACSSSGNADRFNQVDSSSSSSSSSDNRSFSNNASNNNSSAAGLNVRQPALSSAAVAGPAKKRRNRPPRKPKDPTKPSGSHLRALTVLRVMTT
jgi:hypothetical protein